MTRLQTHNSRHARRHGPYSEFERFLAHHEDGAALITRIRRHGFPARLCAGIGFTGPGGDPHRLQVMYRLPRGRAAAAMRDSVPFSLSEHAGSVMNVPLRRARPTALQERRSPGTPRRPGGRCSRRHRPAG